MGLIDASKLAVTYHYVIKACTYILLHTLEILHYRPQAVDIVITPMSPRPSTKSMAHS